MRQCGEALLGAVPYICAADRGPHGCARWLISKGIPLPRKNISEAKRLPECVRVALSTNCHERDLGLASGASSLILRAEPSVVAGQAQEDLMTSWMSSREPLLDDTDWRVSLFVGIGMALVMGIPISMLCLAAVLLLCVLLRFLVSREAGATALCIGMAMVMVPVLPILLAYSFRRVVHSADRKRNRVAFFVGAGIGWMCYAVPGLAASWRIWCDLTQ